MDVKKLAAHLAEVAAKAGLSKVSTATQNGREMLAVGLADGTTLLLEPPPLGADPHPVACVRSSVTNLQEFSGKASSIEGNSRLKDSAKVADLAEARVGPLLVVAAEFESLVVFGKKVADREASRYGPPARDFAAGQVLVQLEAIREREIRDRLWGMNRGEQLAVVQRVADGKAPPEILTAILRDPMGLAGSVTEAAATAHRTAIDRADPASRYQLDADGRALDWAERCLYTVAARLRTIAKVDSNTLAEIVSIRTGWPVFGLTAGDIAAAKQRLALRARGTNA